MYAWTVLCSLVSLLVGVLVGCVWLVGWLFVRSAGWLAAQVVAPQGVQVSVVQAADPVMAAWQGLRTWVRAPATDFLADGLHTVSRAECVCCCFVGRSVGWLVGWLVGWFVGESLCQHVAVAFKLYLLFGAPVNRYQEHGSNICRQRFGGDRIYI